MNSFRRLSSAAVALIVTGLLASAPVVAQGRGPQNGNAGQPQRVEQAPRPAASQAPARERSMSESVRWAQKSTGGQVLGAERVQSDGRDFNRVKLIDDRGRVRYVDDVPQSRQSQREAPVTPAPTQPQRR